MSVKLITYDLNNPGQKHSKVLAQIRRDYDSARLSESSYAIDTTDSVDAIFNDFKPLIDGNDTFLVIAMKKPFAGRADQAVLDWLDARL